MGLAYMSLFNQDMGEEEIKKLTGGFLLLNSFVDTLRQNNLTMQDGYAIQKQLKEDYKNGDINLETIKIRLNYLIREKEKINQNKPNNPNQTQSVDNNNIDYQDNTETQQPTFSDTSQVIPEEDTDTIQPISPENTDNNQISQDNTEVPQPISPENTDTTQVTTQENTDTQQISYNMMDLSLDEKFLIFTMNQDYNKVKCKRCNTNNLNIDNYCYRCGEQLKTDNLNEPDNIISLGPVKNKDLKNAKIINSGTIKTNKTNKIKSNNLSTTESNSTYTTTNSTNYNKNDSSENDDEWSDLEKMYNQSIKTQENLNLKYVTVIYLTSLKNNPVIKKYPDSYKEKYHVQDMNSVIEYALNNNYIQKPSKKINALNIANTYNISELKETLKKYNITATGHKDELIKQLENNLNINYLVEEFPGKSYIVTEKGIDFINQNSQVNFYDKYLYNHSIEKYDKLYQENKQNMSLEEITIKYLTDCEKEYVTDCYYGSYRNELLIKAEVYNDLNDKINALKNYIKVYICDINPWDDRNIGSYDSFIIENITTTIIELIKTLKMEFQDLKQLYEECSNDLKIPLHIVSDKESLKYLLKLFNGEKVNKLNHDIRKRYSAGNVYYSFSNKKEEEEVCQKVMSIFE